MGSGLAAKRRGSRGRRRARCAHLTAERVRHGPLAPSSLRSWVKPAGRRVPSCVPAPVYPSAHFNPTWVSPAPKDTGRGALRFPSLPCPLQSRGSRVASPPAATLHNCGGDACPAAARGVTLHVATARATGPPPASPSPPPVGPRPRGRTVPAVVGCLLAYQELGRRCWRSAPGAGGRRESRKNYLSIILKF